MVQIFISHSSKDALLVKLIAGGLERVGVKSYLAEFDGPQPRGLLQELERAISNSTAVFLVLTRNVTRSKRTSEIVHSEFGFARAKKKDIYVFKEKSVKTVPLMIELAVKYEPFDKEAFTEALQQMVNIGKQLKNRENETRANVVKAWGRAIESVFKVILASPPNQGL